MPERPSLRQFTLYFLKLGSVGFGGPIALVGYMHRDLVEDRKWVLPDDYREGLALAQLAPGPLAAQLAIYLGWVRAGVLGATLVGIAFVLPSFLMVLALAALYLRLGGLPWMQGMFYGIGAAVIAIIGRSAWKLVRSTLARDWLLWSIFTVSAVVTGMDRNRDHLAVRALWRCGTRCSAAFSESAGSGSSRVAHLRSARSSGGGYAEHAFLVFCGGWRVRLRERTGNCPVPLRWGGWEISVAHRTAIPRCCCRSHDHARPGCYYRRFHRAPGRWPSGCHRCSAGGLSPLLCAGRYPGAVLSAVREQPAAESLC
jgi:chromate transport protein ChrA